MNRIIKNKINKGIVLAIIIIAFAIALSIMLKYKLEGETNMPFTLKKVLTVSSIEATPNEENSEYKWNLNLNQYNDVYIEIEKNENYKKETYIESITLENFKIEKPQTGEIEIYMPNSKEEKLYSYEDTFKVTGALTYKGANETNPKTLNIANQGGTISFRAVNKNIGKFQSNEGEEISYDGKLLQNAQINQEDITFKISFDIIIKTEKSTFKGRIEEETLPTGDLIKDGVTTSTIENTQNIIFKRII